MGKKNKKDKKSKKSKKLDRELYEDELFKLQIELVKLQQWVVHSGAKVAVVFEGRDAAGKGGMIKRITERVSSRVFRVVALPKPTDREKTQMYWQRYIAHLPAAGEVVLFDRSWYNRAGVERVMGFCEPHQVDAFLVNCPEVEHMIVESGIQLIKYWLTVGEDEQRRRFDDRISDPRKQWKLSPMDHTARRRWYEYSRARDAMLDATDTEFAPWHVVRTDDKRRARLNCISHLLDQIPYEEVPFEAPELPERDEKNAYDDVAALKGRSFIPEIF